MKDKQVYPPSVTDSLMQRIRELAKKGQKDEDAPSEPEKTAEKPSEKRETPDWKAAVGYGPLVLRLDPKAHRLPRVTTLRSTGGGRKRTKSVLSEDIVSFDCWFASAGSDFPETPAAACQYALRRVGERAEGLTRRTVSDEAASYDKPFTVPAAALDGLQKLVEELDLEDLADEADAPGEAPAGQEGCHLAIWYASGESIRCHDSHRSRLTLLQMESIRRWFEAVAGI